MISLENLALLKTGKRKSLSSYDRNGANHDSRKINPGDMFVLGEVEGEGCFQHLWFTFSSPDPMYLRKVLLRIYWDGQEHPSVLAPIGDFFCLGHGKVRRFASLPFAVLCAPEANFTNIIRQAGFNCYLPMPFKTHAKLELFNETEKELIVFYNFDYVLGEGYAENSGRFHANFTRSCSLKRIPAPNGPMSGVNLTGKDNYVILRTEGRGHYIGCNLSLDYRPGFESCHEGDEMIFIDGESFPPSIHGTGTEDYFGSAWSWPCGEFSAPFIGVTVEGLNNFEAAAGQWTFYRFHIPDPIMFEKSIAVTIEHGNANECSGDYSSTAYWYQELPSPVLRIPDIKTRSYTQNRDLHEQFIPQGK